MVRMAYRCTARVEETAMSASHNFPYQTLHRSPTTRPLEMKQNLDLLMESKKRKSMRKTLVALLLVPQMGTDERGEVRVIIELDSLGSFERNPHILGAV